MNEGNGGSLQLQQPVAVSPTPQLSPEVISGLVQQSKPPLPPADSNNPQLSTQMSAPNSPIPPPVPIPPPQVSPPPVVQPIAASSVLAPPAQAPAQAPVSTQANVAAPQAIASATPVQSVQQPEPAVSAPQQTVLASSQASTASSQVPQMATPTLEQISQLLDAQLGAMTVSTAQASPQSPYSKPGLDLRPGATFQPVIQGTPESFAKPMEPQIVETAPPVQPRSVSSVIPESKPESTTTPEGTPVPAHKNLVPPSEDDKAPAIELKSEESNETAKVDQPTTQVETESELGLEPALEPKSLVPIDKIDNVNFVRVNKQISSTGREVDVSKVDNPPKRSFKLGIFIPIVVSVIVLGVASYIAYNYVSQNVMERALSCTTTSGKNVDDNIPAYDATLTVDLIGKTPKNVNTKYGFIYDNVSEAENVAPKDVVAVAKKLNAEYSGFVGDISSPVPMVSGNKITLTLTYSAVDFLNKLTDSDVANETGESIAKKVEDKMNSLGYTCSLGDK